MTSPADKTFLSALNPDDGQSDTGLQTGISAKQRLSMAMRMANEADPTAIPEPSTFSNSRVGLPNPYGRGLRAFEPNNVIFDGYARAKAESDASKVQDAAAAHDAGGTITVGGGATLGDATGQVTKMIQAAMGLAQRAVPYVWGGTTANGVDCSGLIYYAANAAGIKMPRYRAVDYGHMGQAVSVADARPGDIVYYDEAGDTDHVGIYVGNGLMIQAPQSGDHVRVSSIGKPTSIRRLFDDGAFGQVATPDGGLALSYNGRPYNPTLQAPITPQTFPTAPTGSTIYRAPIGRGNQPR